MKAIRIGAIALLVLAAAAIAGVGLPETAGGAESAAGKGITVTGTGTAEAVPDEAQFSLGVTTNGATAREALAANSDRMGRVLAALKAAGIDEQDIKTQDVSVGPDYDYEGKTERGYRASNSVSVHVRELARAGAVLEAASRAGANQVYGPQLSRSDRESFEADALKEAVAHARKRAQALADAAGVELGRVTAITEAPGGGPVIMEALRAKADVGAPAPIEPGTEEIQATVTVTFAIE